MPPPPPPAPPPIPKQLGISSASHNSSPPADRNALLSQIRKGTRLRKAETNDRSAPLVDANKSTLSSSTAKRNADSKSNGPIPIIPPGGLFAQGIPKLRPTFPRSENSPCASLPTIQSIRQNNSTSSLRVNQLSGSRSQPPSPVSKPRISPAVPVTRTVSSEKSESASISSGNPNFPDDINLKGPAPAPPPQSQKPVFRSNTRTETDSSVKFSAVKRSASQTNLQRPRLTRPLPPSEKPPPPPKSALSAPQNAPPPPPSKPPNILRRQSFGVGESHNFQVNSNSNNPSKVISKTVGLPPPPPPPRNNSAPNDLNQLSCSSPNSQWTKMNIAPPPPPNRSVAVSNRSGPVRPPPPRAPAPPPPPPQHQYPVHPAPPSQMKMMPAPNSAPPPPARVSSIKQTDFEERFKSMFQPAQNLPKPDKFTKCAKHYPSKVVRQRQNTRRQPPPPPPQHGLNKPNVPVQYDSGIYSGNFNHS